MRESAREDKLARKAGAPYTVCSGIDSWASSEYNLSLSILQIFILMLDLTVFDRLKKYHLPL